MNQRLPDTDISNWRQHPHSAWALQHVREILPTASIPVARKSQKSISAGNNDQEPWQIIKSDLNDIDLPAVEGCWNLGELHKKSYTDSFVILHKGKVVHRWHAGHVNPALPHIVFSVSKSINACVAGILNAKGIVDFNADVVQYLPGARRSAYADCSIQHVLDMSVALDFEEDYSEPDGDYTRYRNASGWNPVDLDDPGPDLEPYLYSLSKLDEPHGKVFRYRSPNSDLLGLILERAAGMPFANLVSNYLWKPMEAETDAYVTVDRNGLARGAGGICVTIDDLARLGQLIIDGGRSYNGNQVLPIDWIEDTINCGNKKAWRQGSMTYLLPHGCYRNKWYQTGDDQQSIWAMGIHGQYLYVNPTNSVVIAKQSSQPLPVNDPIEIAVMASMQKLSEAIAQP